MIFCKNLKTPKKFATLAFSWRFLKKFGVFYKNLELLEGVRTGCQVKILDKMVQNGVKKRQNATNAKLFSTL